MYAEVNNKIVVTYPYDYDTLVAKNPSTRFGQDTLENLYVGTEDNLAGNTLVRVTQTDAPTVSRYQGVVQDGIEHINGQWFTKWKIVDFDDAAKVVVNDQQAKSVREQRELKLKNSDWTQVADAPVDKAVWAVYRQALRDLPKQSGFPWEVSWPTQP